MKWSLIYLLIQWRSLRMLKPILHLKISAMYKSLIFIASVFLVLALHAKPLYALSTDSEQPIEISADKVQIDNIKGQSIYSGNVELSQGSLHITGSKLIVKTSASGELTRADAYGLPATLTQQPENKELIDAEAEHIVITYDNDQEVILNTKAMLTQGANKFFGDKIRYIVATDQVIADSQKNKRVKVVISPQPSKQDQNNNTKTTEEDQ
ncbi:MAG: lipopolysaccharide transport periplasmic protein LptA [Gammaproteobacteria bacterium]|nr:MAG: lipopolysaccharide transport periplasmic protein LptA [Gammaproteobacteria bacterium]